MSSAFDKRLISVTIDFPDGTNQTFDQGFAIYAQGSLFGNALQSSCELRIYNLTRELRNYLITKASPLLKQRTPITMSLNVGRESYGTFLLFIGNMISCEVTQPPDIGVVLRSLTNNYFTGAILSTQQPAITLLSQIAASVAASMKLTLAFFANDQQIDNHSFTAGATYGIDKLNQYGVHAFVDKDGKTLVVLNPGQARPGSPFILNESTGMIGIPQVTDQGVNANMMIANGIRLGGNVTIQSVINPAANGTYVIRKLNFEVASRDQPFWYTLVTSNLAPYFQGNVG